MYSRFGSGDGDVFTVRVEIEIVSWNGIIVDTNIKAYLYIGDSVVWNGVGRDDTTEVGLVVENIMRGVGSGLNRDIGGEVFINDYRVVELEFRGGVYDSSTSKDVKIGVYMEVYDSIGWNFDIDVDAELDRNVDVKV